MNVPSPSPSSRVRVASWILGLAMLGSVTGCVTTQQYEALQVQLDEAEGENSALRLARQDAEVNSRELEGRLSRLTQEQETLTKEAQQLGADAKRCREEVARLAELNEALTDQSSGRLSDIAQENRQLLEDVMAIREELQRREDALNQLEKDLNEKSQLLVARSQRVEELESMLEARERAADCLLYTSPSPRDRTRSRMPSSA